MIFNFLGPSNPLNPVNVDVERSINLYPELTAPGSPKTPLSLRNTPGRHVATVVNAYSIDVLFTDGSATPSLNAAPSGRCFGIAGTVFFEVVAVAGVYSTIVWGTVALSFLPGQQTSIASNGDGGHQLLIVSGGNGYIFNLQTNAFGLISDADFPNGSAAQGVFLDGYFIVLNYTNSSFQLSALNDGTSWNALDIAQRSDASDRLTALAVFRNELWLIGSLTTEVWYDSGDNLFPFTRVQGSLMQIGCVYPFTIQVLDNALWFLGQEHSQGQPVVYRATSYSPAVVSTIAVANAVAQTTSTAHGVMRAWTYEDSGHAFYVLRLPYQDGALSTTTWVYDQSTQLWHERGVYDFDAENDDFAPDPVKCHVFQFGVHLVGDHDTPTIWTMDNSFYSDEIVA